MIDKEIEQNTVKLTSAQYDLLRTIACQPMNCVMFYRPAIKLIEFGFAEWHGTEFNHRLAITQAGRDRLKEEMAVRP